MTQKKRPIPFRLVTVRRADRVAEGAPTVSSPDAAAQVLMSLIGNKDREHFVVFHLDSRNHILAAEIVGVGILTACLVHPREVFKAAILNGAAAIIVGHNHPSGDVTPSSEDKALHERLRAAGAIVGIELLDFLVASDRRYWSSRESGGLNQ